MISRETIEHLDLAILQDEAHDFLAWYTKFALDNEYFIAWMDEQLQESEDPTTTQGQAWLCLFLSRLCYLPVEVVPALLDMAQYEIVQPDSDGSDSFTMWRNQLSDDEPYLFSFFHTRVKQFSEEQFPHHAGISALVLAVVYLVEQEGNEQRLDSANNDETKYGKCCLCLEDDLQMIGLVSMPYLALTPDPTSGWACLQCDLGRDHKLAIAALCETCSYKIDADDDHAITIEWVVTDSIEGNDRTHISELPGEKVGHDLSKHPEIHEYN